MDRENQLCSQMLPPSTKLMHYFEGGVLFFTFRMGDLCFQLKAFVPRSPLYKGRHYVHVSTYIPQLPHAGSLFLALPEGMN